MKIKAVNFAEKSEEELGELIKFYPKYKNQIEVPKDLLNQSNSQDEVEQPNQEIQKLEKQIKENRDEAKELLSEYFELKEKLDDDFTETTEKEMATLKDDCQFFQAENLELKTKIKALVTQNLEFKKRVIELNDIIKSQLLKMSLSSITLFLNSRF